MARGTQVPAGTTLVRTDRDEDDALAPVAQTRWDAVVDVARHPGHVRRAVQDLEAHAEQYLFVSSCSTYASLAADGIDETAQLSEPLRSDVMESLTEYGEAKAACEEAVLAGFGAEHATIVRPGLIGGPGDPSGRTSYWPLRFARPSNQQGKILVPDAPGQSTSEFDRSNENSNTQ